MLEHIPHLITDEENKELSSLIDEAEVRSAIWSLDPDKDSGPDGFLISFYHKLWDIIKQDMCRML
jgi:hypothetical protein